MNHWGGKRNNSGRKPIQYSEAFKLKLWKALEKEAREQGKSVYEIFAKNIMKQDVEPRIFARLWKILSEVMAARETHQTIENRQMGPTIGLPPIRKPDITESSSLRTAKDVYKQ
jgi:hypothetical protein